MPRWLALGLVAVLLVSGCARGTGTGPAPSRTPPAPADVQSSPQLQQVDYGGTARGANGGYTLTFPTAITAVVKHAASVHWLVTSVYPGPDTPITLPTVQTKDNTWVANWPPPPAQPVVLALYAEVPPGVPDSVDFSRADDKRWAILTKVRIEAAQPPPSAPALHLMSTHFQSDTVGWVGGVQGGCGSNPTPALLCLGFLYHTIDGGAHWSRAYTGDVTPLAITFVSDQVGWAAGGTAAADVWVRRDQLHPGTLLHTTDGGRTWTTTYVDPDGALRSVSFPSAHEGWITDTLHHLLHTTDGGQTWTPVPITCADWVSFPTTQTGFALCGADQPGAGHGSKALQVTHDRGQTWTLLDDISSPQTQRPGGMPFSGYADGILFHNPLEGWITFSRGGLFHTLDGGQTWHSLLADRSAANLPTVADGLDLSAVWGLSFPTPSTGYAVVGNQLAVTHDAARTWTPVRLPTVDLRVALLQPDLPFPLRLSRDPAYTLQSAQIPALPGDGRHQVGPDWRMVVLSYQTRNGGDFQVYEANGPLGPEQASTTIGGHPGGFVTDGIRREVWFNLGQVHVRVVSDTLARSDLERIAVDLAQQADGA